MTESHPDIAIVICTYNPEEQIFNESLRAIENLSIPERLDIECVIIDNNSAVEIVKHEYIKKFLNKCKWAKVIRETKQGLAFARFAGLRATAAPIISFFDDDNLPDLKYLEGINKVTQLYPLVGVWGPGKVDVAFLGHVPERLTKYFKTLFGKKDLKQDVYDCVPAKFYPFYPIGTGQVVKREILEKYASFFENENFKTLDRCGSSLSSWGDIQIVWQAINMGMAVGLSPILKVRHLISERKTDLCYLKHLQFGVASTYHIALIEMYPGEKTQACSLRPIKINALKAVVAFIGKCVLKPYMKTFHLLAFAYRLGYLAGAADALKSSDKKFVYRLARWFQFVEGDKSCV